MASDTQTQPESAVPTTTTETNSQTTSLCGADENYYSGGKLAIAFCYPQKNIHNYPVVVNETGNTVNLTATGETDPASIGLHIERLSFDASLDPVSAINTLFIIGGDKTACHAVMLKLAGVNFQDYAIAAASDETECGSYADVSLRSFNDVPGTLVTIPEKGPFASMSWTSTISSVATL